MVRPAVYPFNCLNKYNCLNNYNFNTHHAISAPPSTSSFTFTFIADTGASGHYLPTSYLSLLIHVLPHTTQCVILPDGSRIFSSHIGKLPFSQFPSRACTAYIFPELSHALLSIAMFCTHGYQAVFTGQTVHITAPDNPTPLLAGTRAPSNLWVIPVTSHSGYAADPHRPESTCVFRQRLSYPLQTGPHGFLSRHAWLPSSCHSVPCP